MKDFRRHEFATFEDIRQFKKLRLFALTNEHFAEHINKRLQALLPYTQTEITIISSYEEFFSHSDDQVDGLLELIEVGSTLTLLHPEYTSVLPKPSVTKFPLSYAVAKGEKDFALFLSHWLAAKKANAIIHHAYKYWIFGKGAESNEPRWSIMHNVLGQP